MAMTETERTRLTAEHEAGELGLMVATMPAALALVVLGILALAKIDPWMLIAIGVIIAGIMVASDSAAISQKIASALAANEAHRINAAELPAGLGAGVLGGIAGVVLGILAILGVASQTLIAVAIIVYGASVLLDFAARAQLQALRMTRADTPEHSARLALATASSTRTAAAFTAVGLVALGIIALAGLAGEVLTAVALLGLGAYVLLEEGSVAGHLMNFSFFGSE